MATTILDLEPKRMWYHFNKICGIPHSSGHEAGVRDYIISVAKENGLEHIVDKAGNLVIRKPANKSPSKNGVILQGHMDMVCEWVKGKVFDPLKDSVKPVIDGEWLKADGTSLGADNAVALATALVIFESKDITHGPLEGVFTVEEETGLFGAIGFEKGLLKGKTFINMDTEVENTIYVGCAGGNIQTFHAPITYAPAKKGTTGVKLTVKNMTGGHSGIEIHAQRGNAIKVLGRIIWEINNKYGAENAEINGGTKHNVIPSFATATIAVKDENAASAKKMAEDLMTVLRSELRHTDPNLVIEAADANIDKVIVKEDSEKILDCIVSSQHGVIKMSQDISGLVQTSANFAIVNTDADKFMFQVNVRSSVASEQESGMYQFVATAELIGGKMAERIEFPGWQPDMSSKVLKIFTKLYKDTYKSEPIVTSVHAGLECGVIGSKYPGLDMIAYGPELHDVHSFNEKLNIASAKRFYDFIVKSVEILAQE